MNEFKTLRYYEINNDQKTISFITQINEQKKELDTNICILETNNKIKESKINIHNDIDKNKSELINSIKNNISETELKTRQTNDLVVQLDESLKTLRDIESSLKHEEILFKKESNDKIRKITEYVG